MAKFHESINEAHAAHLRQDDRIILMLCAPTGLPEE